MIRRISVIKVEINHIREKASQIKREREERDKT